MSTKNIKVLLPVLLSLGWITFAISSCKKLDPQVYDQIRPEDFFKTEDQIVAFTSSGYGNVAGHFGIMT